MTQRGIQRGRHRPLRRRRKGATLVLAILFIIVIMALAGLVIDLGVARLTQSRMQTLADVAALEGLRFRDATPPHFAAAANASQRDLQRREWVNQLLALAHDALPARSVRATGGVPIGDSGYHALRTLDTEPEVYVPTLLADPAANETNPEMASGQYGLNAGYPEGEYQDALIDAGLYSRRDFTRAAADEAPSGNGFFVQLRRSTDNVDPDDATASGGPLPYLFAAGSLVDIGQFASGINLRAPAVASVGQITIGDESYETGRAKSVGPAQPNSQLAGVAPFGVHLDAWRAFAEQSDLQLTLTISGQQVLNGAATWGQIRLEDRVEAIGQEFRGGGSAADVTAVADTRSLRTYVPVYLQDNAYFDGRAVIVGFVFLTWEWNEPTLTVQRSEREVIGSGNVSATLALPLPTGNTSDRLTIGQIDQLFTLHAHQDQAHPFPFPLLSPALTNRHLGRQP